MANDGVAILTSQTGHAAVEELCAESGVDEALLSALVAAVLDQSGKLRRRGLFDRFDALLGDAR